MKKNGFYTLGSLIILLICAFVFVILPAFTGSCANQNKARAFGKYNGKKICYEQGTDFADFVSNYGQMFQSYGQQLDSSSYYYIFNYAFNSTVMKMAYTDEVNSSGYIVPKSAVTRKMVPYFYDENGKYSSKLYKQTPADIVSNLKKECETSLISQRYYDDNFGSDSEILGYDALYGLKESDKELDFLNSMNYKKRGFDVAVFSLNDYPDSEKIAFGKANADKFTKYDLSIITVSDKATANTVAKRIANEEITFEDAISEYSEKNFSNTEGKLTYKYQYQIETILNNKDDLAAISSLANNEVSSIIETSAGFSIFMSNAAAEKADFENADIISAVGSYLTVYEKSIIEDYFTAKAKDFTAAAMNTTFDNACAQFNIDKGEIAPFPLNFGNTSLMQSLDTSISGLSNADSNEAFLKAAFSLKLNELSEPVIVNNNVVVLKFTTEENAEDDDAYISEITTYDQNSTSAFFMNSPKLENNFAEVYYKNFLNN